MIRELSYLALGAAIAFAAVVAVTPGGPVDVSLNLDGSSSDRDAPFESNPRATVAGDAATPRAKNTAHGPQAGIDPVKLEWEIHKQINEVRQSSGLGRLKMLPELRTAARGHSRDMARNGFVGHTGSDGDGYEERYEEVGFRCNVAKPDQAGEYLTGGENVAYRTTSTNNETVIAQRIVKQWMGSQGHRENILTEAWYREGIGVAVTSTGEVYATQNFC